MKKSALLGLSLLAALCLTACPAPNSDSPAADQNKTTETGDAKTDTGGTSAGTGLASLSKTQFLEMMDCLIEELGSSPAAAGAGSAKATAAAVPDASWNATVSGIGGTSLKVWYDQALKNSCDL